MTLDRERIHYMGKSTTPRYRIEFTSNVYMTPHARDAKMTTLQLEGYRKALNASFQPGGVNAAREGIVPHISRLRLIDQRTGDVINGCCGPLFEVT